MEQGNTRQDEISVYMNGRKLSIPVRDYLEIKAQEYGYDSYAEMKKAGYHIELPRQQSKKSKSVER